ncbi:MAG: hypothetical protein ISR64_11600 [Deltaproteobacteria bacterium]|nr:hypothetical protein [Deltaproteobacteria bacterium]
MRTRQGKFRILLVVGATLFMGSCDWGADGPSHLRDTYPTSCNAEDAITTTPDSLAATVGSDSLAGRWALMVVQEGTFAPLNEEWDITLTDLLIVDIPSDQSGAYLLFCDQINEVDTRFDDPDNPDAQHPMKPETVLSQALKDANISQYIPFTDPLDGGLPKTELLWFWGITGLDDSATDPLPDDEASPNVWDEDADGHPGVTVTVLNPVQGDRYMVRRATWTMGAGALTGNQLWVAGDLLEFQIEETALDATDALLLTLAPITAKKTGNTWRMRRVLSDFSCRDLIQQHGSLFDDAPEL